MTPDETQAMTDALTVTRDHDRGIAWVVNDTGETRGVDLRALTPDAASTTLLTPGTGAFYRAATGVLWITSASEVRRLVDRDR